MNPEDKNKDTENDNGGNGNEWLTDFRLKVFFRAVFTVLVLAIIAYDFHSGSLKQDFIDNKPTSWVVMLILLVSIPALWLKTFLEANERKTGDKQ